MKIHILLFYLILSIHHNLSAQQNVKFWVSCSKNDIIENGSTLLKHLGILQISQAFPSSKKKQLQIVYEIKCTHNADLTIDSINLGYYENFFNATIVPVNEPLFIPNDYNLTNYSNYALNLINAPNAWQLTQGDSSISIAILDTNYDIYHEELFNKIVYIDSTNGSNQFIHGTAVAITAGGETDNSIGISSIGNKSSLELRSMTYNQILAASYSGVKVINLSWSSGCFYNQYCQDVINEAYNNGSIIVAAAGNGSTCMDPNNLVFPASYEHVISVTSIGPNNNHERIIGDPNSTHQHNDSVDICAPGYDVLVSPISGQYASANGTSFAAPYVSGTIGLMFAVNPCLTFENILEIFELTSLNLDDLNVEYAGKLGFGRIDAAAAVSMASMFNTIPITIEKGFNCADSTYELLVSSNSNLFENSVVYWDNGQEGVVIDNLNQGEQISGFVLNDEGCFTNFLEVLDSIETVTVNVSKNDVLCFGESTGDISIDIFTQNPNYNLFWDNGNNEDELDSLAAGNYTFYISRFINCIDTFTVTIDEPQKLKINFITEQISLLETVRLDATCDGGYPDYSYSWNTGENSSFINAKIGGFYEVEVTDINGCINSRNIIIPIIEEEFINENLCSVQQEDLINPNCFYIQNDILVIDSHQILDYQFYSSSGQKVDSKLFEKIENCFILNKLKSGIYFGYFETIDRGLIVVKFVMH